MNGLARILLVGLCVCLPASALWAEVPVPFLEGRVVDLAGVISPNTKAELDAELAGLEAATGAQVAVLVVPTLDGEAVESFGLRVVETWKLGKKGQDNGVLLLIARDDRRMRIEVGYGLEGVLPDVLCSRILNERLVPRFKTGDFDGGIREAVAAIGGVVRGDPAAMPEPSGGGSGGGGGLSGVVLIFVIGLVLFNVLMPIVLSAVHSKVMGWVLYPLVAIPAFLVPTAVTGNLTLGIVCGVVWLVLFPLLKMFSKHLPKAGSVGGSGWSSRGGGWSSGGGGGWSSGGGGGFSGGGGSFGGGGASGSW